MFGEKIFNFSEPISRKTVRIVILVSFLAYQGMRLLWKQGLISYVSKSGVRLFPYYLLAYIMPPLYKP